MEKITSNYSISVPKDEENILLSFVKKMGWKIEKNSGHGIKKGLEDIKKGRIYHAKDTEDMMKQIFE